MASKWNGCQRLSFGSQTTWTYFDNPSFHLPIMESHMLSPHRSDDVIEALVHVACGETASVQVKHIYRESLRNLVRLAKAERTQEMKIDFGHFLAENEWHMLH